MVQSSKEGFIRTVSKEGVSLLIKMAGLLKGFGCMASYSSKVSKVKSLDSKLLIEQLKKK